MDEEQQEEQQQQQGQEQPIAPAAFTNLNITPAPRRPISTFSLFNIFLTQPPTYLISLSDE